MWASDPVITGAGASFAGGGYAWAAGDHQRIGSSTFNDPFAVLMTGLTSFAGSFKDIKMVAHWRYDTSNNYYTVTPFKGFGRVGGIISAMMAGADFHDTFTDSYLRANPAKMWTKAAIQAGGLALGAVAGCATGTVNFPFSVDGL
jgi:hypothetical protein